MRKTVAVHPCSFIETDGVDDQYIPFPMTRGMAVIARNQVSARRVWPAIHINRVKAMRAAIVDDVDTLQLRHVQNLEAIRSRPQAWPRRGFAPGIRLVFKKLRMPVIQERSGPRLKRNVVDVDWCCKSRARLIASRVDCQAAAAAPKSLFSWR